MGYWVGLGLALTVQEAIADVVTVECGSGQYCTCPSNYVITGYSVDGPWQEWTGNDNQPLTWHFPYVRYMARGNPSSFQVMDGGAVAICAKVCN